MIVVVPPQAAARVPVSKVSEACVPPKGSSMCVCGSIPPGITYMPVASTTASTFCSRSTPSSVEPGFSTAAMVSPSTSTSAAPEPVLLITVPFLINVVLIAVLRSRPGDGVVRVRPPVTVELPGVAYLPEHVKVKIAYYDVLVLIAAHSAHHVALRITELATAIEGNRQLAVLVVLPPDTIRRGNEVAVGRGGCGLLNLPEPVGEAGLCGVGIEDDLRPVQTTLPPSFGKVSVVTDVDPDRSDRRLKHRVSKIPGPEVELFPELVEVRNVVLPVFPEHRTVGVDHHRGVVVNARLLLLEDRQHHDEVKLGSKRGETLHSGTVGRFGIVVVLDVFGDPEVRPVEQLLEADHLRFLGLCVPGELLMLVEHRFLVAGPGRLSNRRTDHCHAAPPSE